MIDKQPSENKCELNCAELRALAADMLEIALGALRKIASTEDQEVRSAGHAFCISVAGNALRAVQYKIEDASL